MASKNLDTILLMGRPGAGKSLQGLRLCERENIAHIHAYTGLLQDVTRDPKSSDEATIARVLQEIRRRELKPGTDLVVLEGIPKNERQAALLDDTLRVHHAFHLAVPEDIARTRAYDNQQRYARQREDYQDTLWALHRYEKTARATSIDATLPVEAIYAQILDRMYHHIDLVAWARQGPAVTYTQPSRSKDLLRCLRAA